jgi:hypothetical protein
VGYQSASIQTITFTRDGKPVQWIVDFESKTVTVVVGGLDIGIYPNRQAAKDALGLVDVPLKHRSA